MAQNLPCVVEIRVYVVSEGFAGMDWMIHYMPKGLHALFKEWVAICETASV
jgi:hypothetical protein